VSQLHGKQWFEQVNNNIKSRIEISIINQQPIKQIIHPKDRDAVTTMFAKINTEDVQLSAEFRLPKAGDTKVWVLGQLISERSKTGEAIGYVGTLTEVTDRKRLEKERLKAAKELAQQKTRTREAQYYQQQQEQFIDMICHEIR